MSMGSVKGGTQPFPTISLNHSPQLSRAHRLTKNQDPKIYSLIDFIDTYFTLNEKLYQQNVGVWLLQSLYKNLEWFTSIAAVFHCCVVIFTAIVAMCCHCDYCNYDYKHHVKHRYKKTLRKN